MKDKLTEWKNPLRKERVKLYVYPGKFPSASA
jgi:hypothetical protein